MPGSKGRRRGSWRVGETVRRAAYARVDRVRSALRDLPRGPSRSLTSRIILLVFTATVLTALLVTWASIQSIHGFLSAQINEKFPELLSATGSRLELWYDQVRLDVDTFARSGTMEANSASLLAARDEETGRRANEEIRNYLSYILEQFDQYDALFLLDERGSPLLWVGVARQIPDDLRERLATLDEPRVGRMLLLDSERLQLASAPIKQGDRRVATLHALLDLEVLDRLLRSEDLAAGSEVFLIGEESRYLTPTRTRAVGDAYNIDLPEEGAPARVRNYASPAGEHVVGASVRFSRFDWTLVVEEGYDAAFAPVFRLVGRVLLWNLAIVLVFGAVALRIAISIVQPLRALSQGAERVADGETGIEIPDPGRNDELSLLTRTFNQMTERLHRHQRELRRQNKKLEVLSITDELTRVYNHRYFVEQLPVEIKRARREGNILSLIMIDIDDFKRLNDSFGHAAGDEVLRSVAEVMYAQIRDTDVLARYGGEEFALLTAQRRLEGARVLAEKVRAAVAALPVSIETARSTREIGVTVSVGVAAFKGNAKRLFHDADRALYAAKAAGKDCVVVDGE